MASARDRAQQFDRRIDIYKRQEVTDGLGTKDYTFVLYRRMWAKKVIPRLGAERFEAGQNHAVYTAAFRVRYCTDLDATMRVVCNGENFDLAAPPVDIDGKHTITELRCINGTGDGRRTP